MPLNSLTTVMILLLLVSLVASAEGSLPIFVPLSCNVDLSVDNCTGDNVLSSFVSTDNETVIPCGSCTTVDVTDGSTLSFPSGLNVEGMLYFPPASNVVVETNHIFVQGVFKIDPPNVGNTVRIRMIGSASNFLRPHPENSLQCPLNGCHVGKKAIAVAGGKLDINGLSDPDCPAWTSLESISDGNILTVGSKAAECWGIGEKDEILVTNSEIIRGWDRHFLRTVDSTDLAAGTVNITETIDSAPMTREIDPEMAAEVAWLTRRVVFEADLDGTSNLHGGHLIIYFTPNETQRLEGVEIRSFGQQGNLGRYPIHFHMSDNVKGSVIRKNVIRSSKQRCVVIHGTDEVLVEDNVAYDTKGHCYVLEDGAEMENTFRGNLGAQIGRPSFGIGTSDHSPSIFWITNTKNHFIGNVAAGSSFAGYWTELKAVRGLSKDLPKNKGLDPLYLPLYTFENNVGHSCGNTGFRTYGPGWRNRDDKEFNGIKSYRNNMGFFLHGTSNLKIQNALFADNTLGILSYGNLIRNYLANSTIIGVPERYRESRCPAGMIGVQFGLEEKTQIQISDTSFSGFGTMPEGCTTSGVALKQGANSNNYRPRHAMPIVFNLSFDTNAVYAFDMENNVKLYDRNIYFEDLDGSMNPSGKPGFFINGISPHMTTFLEDSACSAFPKAWSYAHFCENVCLRKLVVRTPCCYANPNIFDYEMVVRSDDDPTKMFVFGKDVQFSSTFTFELTLPAGNFNIDFIDPENGNIMIPDEKDITYWLDTAPHCNNHINIDSITFNYKLTPSPMKTKVPSRKTTNIPSITPSNVRTKKPTSAPMAPTSAPFTPPSLITSTLPSLIPSTTASPSESLSISPTESLTRSPTLGDCEGRGKSDCKKFKSNGIRICTYGAKKLKTKMCIAKKNKHTDDCSDIMDKKQCKDKMNSKGKRKICEFTKPKNPCFKICHRKNACPLKLG